MNQTDVSLSADACDEILSYISDVGGKVLPEDVRKLVGDWEALTSIYIEYLTVGPQTTNLYKALHVDDSTKTPIFQAFNPAVRASLISEIGTDYTSYYDYLQSSWIPTLIYSGEWDQGNGPLSVNSWIKDSKYLSTDIWESPRKSTL